MGERKHDLDLSIIRDLVPCPDVCQELTEVAHRIEHARQKGSAVIFMMGAHVIRSGVQRYIIDLIEKGFITCIATNGAAAIHDYELSLIGATTESVDHYIQAGQFGLWHQTGQMNDIVSDAARNETGLGEAVGSAILDQELPNRDISLFAACYRCNIPITVHTGIGYDIVHEHPNCDGASHGAASYRDFLILANILDKLENGVVMNFGSAVMAPEIFLKALAMARNVAAQENRSISDFSTLVCDLIPLPSMNLKKEPVKQSHLYYFRPWKTMLARTVKDKGKSYYVKGFHHETIPQLWTAICRT